MDSLLCANSSRFREGLILTFFLLATAVGFCGCDGAGSTRVSGPEFVGFGYTEEVFAGTWSGSVSVPDVETFVTVAVELGPDGDVVDGRLSLELEVTGGKFSIDDGATGTVSYRVFLGQNSEVHGRGVLEPPAGVVIQADASIGETALGILVLGRLDEFLPLEPALLAGSYKLLLIPGDSTDERVGSLLVHEEGSITSAPGDGIAVSQGVIRFVEEGALSRISANLTLEGDEIIRLNGVYSIVDGRIAGTFDALSPKSSGTFSLDPRE